MPLLEMYDKAWEKADEFQPTSPRWAFVVGAVVGVISGICLGAVIVFLELENLWQIASFLLVGGSSILMIFAILVNDVGTFQEVVTASFACALGFVLGCLSITFVVWAFTTLELTQAIAVVFVSVVITVDIFNEWSFQKRKRVEPEVAK